MDKFIASFRDLRVYQLAMEVQQEVFELTKGFPKEEAYSLKDQIRRSSPSVGANLAEAWQKRRYPAHFVSKLTDADAEQTETQHWLDTSLACQYVTGEKHQKLLGKYQRIGKMLGTMISKPEKFCSPSKK